MVFNVVAVLKNRLGNLNSLAHICIPTYQYRLPKTISIF